MHEYYSIFAEELKKLNEEQRKAALEYLDGPVMVIAGPGTGKTQILTARIGVLLSSPDLQVSPHNILCLTYTEAGAIAMKQRLLRFIGPEAHRVTITTFHSFCNQIIQEHPEVFGSKVQQVLSDLERVQLFEELIDSFQEGNPLKRYKGDTYFEMTRLHNMFEAMRKESWTVKQIEEACTEFAKAAKRSEEFYYKNGPQKGKFKEGKFEELKSRLLKTVYAARQLEHYENLKVEKGRYDFSDMIYWVLEALRNQPHLLLDYQERFQYILVDEYQDTSGAQNELLFLLANYWDNPNLFVVGDEDQSIYRFQGANIYNILHFQEKFREHVRTVVLKKNYRSVQSILDGAAAVVKNNRERLSEKFPEIDKNLHAANPALTGLSVKPQVAYFINETHEELFLINELVRMHQAGEDLSEVAVLYGKHRHAENIIRVLQKRGVPLNIRRKLDILELPLIRNIITLLQYLWSEYKRPDSAEEKLYELFHFDFFQIHPQDIHVLLRQLMKPPSLITQEDLELEQAPEMFAAATSARTTWRMLMQDAARLDALPLQNRDAIVRLEQLLESWQQDIPNLTLQVLFERILTQGGIFSRIMSGEESAWEMQVVSTFFDYLKEESARQPEMQLGDFLHQLRMLRKYDIVIPARQYIQAANGVHFVTAHSSKGLEYKKVFVMRCTAREWEDSKDLSGVTQYLIPPTLLKQTLPEHLMKLEEQRRLFYVALTRAKESLWLSLPQYDSKDKPLAESMYVTELLSSGHAEKKTIHLPDAEVLKYRLELMHDDQRPVIALAEESFMRERLQNFAMTVTHLNKYLRCPISFYFENVLKVPASRTESSGFGNAIHRALQHLFSEMNRNQKTFPDKVRFLKLYQEALGYYQSHFTRKEFALRLEYGSQLLADYYDFYVAKWNTQVSLEYEIRNVEVDGIPVKGKLDKVEYLGNEAVAVIDYKTGKVSASKIKEQLSPPSEQFPLGGDYWRQIVFYKLLLDHQHRRKMKMLYGEIDFIEKDKDSQFQKRMVEVSESDLSIVKGQLKDSYTRIMNLEFSQGCGKPHCTWCNFVKNNYRSENIQFVRDLEEDASTELETSLPEW
ncbi:MAG: ATP-dependent helicase [Cytophagaceae bacterium]|jgi:DNA helicase-2/ATP-dependent DNA helicase PcrA|nr:ATP-dependent helicase [Cytophagaceae bacterium]